MRAAIARVTLLVVEQTLNTHHHPHHFFGNQVFRLDVDRRVPARVLAIAGIEAEGKAFNEGLYRLVMTGCGDTEVVL
ncbi:hypothetical protein [Thauera humireducens]|uniref:hypothetical protein n=1 Tax=Thauera humireducens TaxID=1134435 RepID=UPI00311D3253